MATPFPFKDVFLPQDCLNVQKQMNGYKLKSIADFLFCNEKNQRINERYKGNEKFSVSIALAKYLQNEIRNKPDFGQN